MGYKQWADRSKSQDPEAILTMAGLKPGMTFVDIGCGEGFFAIPAARRTGKTGRVYCTDIDRDAIDVLKIKASIEKLENVRATVGSAEDTVVCDASADMAFFGICLHDFKDPAHVLRNARHMLKPSGRLINVDWKKLHMDMGPPYDIRFDEAKASRLIEDAGFQVKSAQDVGQHFYMIIAIART